MNLCHVYNQNECEVLDASEKELRSVKSEYEQRNHECVHTASEQRQIASPQSKLFMGEMWMNR